MLKKIMSKGIKTLIITVVGYTVFLNGSGRDTTTCSNIVMGANQNVRDQKTNCGPVETEAKSINAAGDKVSWGDVSSAIKNAEKWNTITSTEFHTLYFPKAGEKRVISLTPTDGNLNNKKIQILLVSFDKRVAKNHSIAPLDVQKQFEKLREDTQFNSMIKIYTKTEKESLWTELYEIFSDQYPHSKKLEIKVSVSPAGIIKTEQTIQETDEEGTMHAIKPFEINLAAFE